MELAQLYQQMARARAFELAAKDLWEQGLIAGEMHLGTGEEAVAAGVVTHLEDGDGLSLTHRCTPALAVRGVPLAAMLSEMLGKPGGLCGGRGGHMHLFSRPHLAASSGIVGASLPTGAGFALAAKRLRRGKLAVALTGEGAMNQGMALETLNLAAAWSLPLLVVCIDNGWAITTRSDTVTAGKLGERARAFGWKVKTVDGRDVESVYAVAGTLLGRLRAGKGPAFLHATCPRLDGHFLGDPLLQTVHDPLGKGRARVQRVVSGAATRGGGSIGTRALGVAHLMTSMTQARLAPQRDSRGDPLQVARKALGKRRQDHAAIDTQVQEEIRAAVDAALAGEGGDA